MCKNRFKALSKWYTPLLLYNVALWKHENEFSTSSLDESWLLNFTTTRIHSLCWTINVNNIWILHERKKDENDLKRIQRRRTLTIIIIRVMTGFILYCINFTRNNNFTNHDMSLLWNNPPSMMIMMICLFFCLIYYKLLFTTQVIIHPHILPTLWTYKIYYWWV